MNLLSILANSTSGGAGTGIAMILVYVVIFGGFMYFLMIRPQKKQQKEVSNMISSMEIGDSVMTTSGFYGIVIDINDDVVIVEFGNNKNCRIPMQKSAVAQVEKVSDSLVSETK